MYLENQTAQNFFSAWLNSNLDEEFLDLKMKLFEYPFKHFDVNFKQFEKIRSELVKNIESMNSFQKRRAFEMLFNLGDYSMTLNEGNLWIDEGVPWYQASEREIYEKLQPNLLKNLDKITNNKMREIIACKVIESPMIDDNTKKAVRSKELINYTCKRKQ